MNASTRDLRFTVESNECPILRTKNVPSPVLRFSRPLPGSNPAARRRQQKGPRCRDPDGTSGAPSGMSAFPLRGPACPSGRKRPSGASSGNARAFPRLGPCRVRIPPRGIANKKGPVAGTLTEQVVPPAGCPRSRFAGPRALRGASAPRAPRRETLARFLASAPAGFESRRAASPTKRAPLPGP